MWVNSVKLYFEGQSRFSTLQRALTFNAVREELKEIAGFKAGNNSVRNVIRELIFQQKKTMKQATLYKSRTFGRQIAYLRAVVKYRPENWEVE